MKKRDVFQAIADPNRRAILALLAQRKLTLNGVAENFTISRPAVSRHIKILVECGLVQIHKQGREHICEVRAEKLDDVAGWIEQYRRMWDYRFVRLEEYFAGVPKKEQLVDNMTNQPESDLPIGLGSPARRALAAAGCLRLEQLARLSEAEVRQMHGIGPNALEKLRSALHAKGLVFAGEA